MYISIIHMIIITVMFITLIIATIYIYIFYISIYIYISLFQVSARFQTTAPVPRHVGTSQVESGSDSAKSEGDPPGIHLRSSKRCEMGHNHIE